MFSSPTLIITLNICVFIVGVHLLTKILPSYRRIEIRWLTLFVIAVCIISFCGINVYVQNSLAMKIEFSRLRYLGLTLIAQSWFFFLTSTFSGRHFLHRPWIIALIFAPVLCSVMMVLVPTWGPLLTTNYQLLSWQGASLVTFAEGPWFLVHITFAYLFSLSGLIYGLYKMFDLKGPRRTQLIILSLGGLVSLAIDTYCVLTNSPLRWAMASGGVFLLTEGAILYAVVRHGLLDLPSTARMHIFRQLPDPIIILDDQNQIIDFNPAAGVTFNLNGNHLHRSLLELLSVPSFSSEKSISEWIHVGEDNLTRHFQIAVEPLIVQKLVRGKIVGFHELTAQKEVEKKLNHHLEFKARLLAMISHDFSNVLQTQTALSSNLERDVGPELRTQAGILADSTFASRDLMTNILLWTRAQENSFQPVVCPFEINTLLKEVVNNLESLWKVRELKVKIYSDLDPLILNGDGVMIESVIRNLFTNAIRASSSGQSIEISLKSSLSEVQIIVRDEGIGMSQKQLQAVRKNSMASFVDTNKRSMGFGLGVSIAQRFVDLHNGRMEFVSQKNHGTSVTLTLPL